MPDALTPALVGGLAFALGAVAQAVSGFGFALVAVPTLALALDPVAAVVAVSLGGLPLTATVALRQRAHVERRLAARLIVAGVLGLPLGLWALTRLPTHGLLLTMSLVLVVLVAALARRLPLPTGRSGQWGAGLAAGALLGATGMNGPPLVLLLAAMSLPPRTFRATLSAVFSCQSVVAVPGFVASGAVTPAVLVAIGAGFIGLWGGWRLGDAVFARLRPEVFRRVVLVGLMITAVVMFARALAA